MRPDDHLFDNVSHISRQELEHYLSAVLHLDPVSCFERPLTKAFLSEVYTAYSRNVAYSSLSIMMIPPEEKTLPTIEQVRECGLKNRSGLCYQTNVFLSWVLIGLGFKVTYLLLATFRKEYGKDVPRNHIGLVVRLEGEDYFLDAGAFVKHAPHLIPLSFEGVTPVYNSSLWEFRFYKRSSEDGRYDRITGAFRWTDGSAFPFLSLPFIEDDFAMYLDAELRYYTLEEVEPSMKRAHQDPALSRVIYQIFVYCYKDDRLKLLKNTQFFWEDELGAKHEKRLETKDEIVTTILEYFGDFHNWDAVPDAVEHFLVSQAEAKQMGATAT